MRLFKRILAAFVAVLAGLAMSAGAAYAATGTITVTPPSGTESGQQTTYQLYKVFVAAGSGTGISYHTVNTGDIITDSNGDVLTHSKDWNLPDVAGKYEEEYPGTTFNSASLPSFVFDTTGEIHWATIDSGATPTVHQNADNSTVNTYNPADLTDVSAASGQTLDLPDYAIHAIAQYIEDYNDSPIQTVHASGTDSVTFSNVDNGYYYVTTTTGSAVSVTSANPNATINDKNEVPTLTKVITDVTSGSVQDGGKKAIAASGSTVTYQVTVSFNPSTNGVASKVVLHDTLDSGLTLTGTPSVVFNAGASGGTATGGHCTVKDTPDSGDSLTIDFSGTSSSVASATVTYTATVDAAGLTSDGAALKNSAYLTYGTNTPTAQTPKQTTSVYNATYTVTKVDNANQPLAGAGFLLYYKGSGDTRYYYHSKSDGTIEWVEVTPTNGVTYENAARQAITDGKIETNATTSSSNDLTFAGLPNGDYYLYELDAPTGYRRAEDEHLVVNDANASNAFEASNLLQTATVTNVPGSQLPTTGDVGTRLLYVAGGCLIVGGAAIILSRKVRAK